MTNFFLIVPDSDRGRVTSQGQSPGFTIIELLVYMSILSLFLLVLTQLFLSALDVQREQESVSPLQQDGRYLLARLAYDMNRAISVTIPANAGDAGSSLQLVVGAVTYSYGLSSGNLTLTTSDGLKKGPLNGYNTQVANLQFVRRGDPGVTISVNFTLSGRMLQRDASQSASFAATYALRPNTY
jgi:type II secretory pathway pseudopilin PulG